MWMIVGFTAVIGALILICVLQLKSKYYETPVRYHGNDVKEAHRFDIYTNLLKKGTQALRLFFDETIPPPSLLKHLADNEDTIKKGQHKLDKKQLQIIYPRSGENPSSALFDITIMYKLLRNTCATLLEEPTSGWGEDPVFDSITKTDDVERIRVHRNTILHATKRSMNQHVFNSYAIDLIQAIIRLSNCSLEKDVLKEVEKELNIKIIWESSLTICASSTDKEKKKSSQQLLIDFCDTFHEIVKRIPQQKDSDSVCITLNKLVPLVDPLIDSKHFVDINELVKAVKDNVKTWSQENPDDAITVLEHQAKWIDIILRKYKCAVVCKIGSLIMEFTFDGYSGYMKYQTDTRAGSLQSEIEKFLRHLSYCRKFGLEPEDISLHMECNKLDVHSYELPSKEETEYSLFNAAEKGHFGVVKYLVQHGTDVNLCNEDRQTPVYIASANGHTDIVQYLIENLAIINMVDVTTPSPLFIASAKGYLDTVMCLIENGIDVNLLYQGKSSLYAASKYGHESVVQFLVEKDADINLIHNGKSPLYVASERGHLGVVKCLLKECKKDQTALDMTSIKGQGADVDLRADENKSQLHEAAEVGNKNIVKYLFKHGADVNYHTLRRKTPLYAASEMGHESIVKYLLQHGADVNFCAFGYRTPLYAAAERGHQSVVKCLIEHGADVNVNTSGHKTALFAASEQGHESIVKYLVEKGANVNFHTFGRKTPMYAASERQHKRVVKYLVEHGADVNFHPVGCEVALFAASEIGNESAV